MGDRIEAERPARRDSPDDIVLPIATLRSRIAGRIVRLGPAADRILTAHDYPDAVSELLGEAIALTALLGTPLKEGGRLILQTKSEGPVSFLSRTSIRQGRFAAMRTSMRHVSQRFRASPDRAQDDCSATGGWR